MFSLIVEVPSDFKAEFYSTVCLYHIFFFFFYYIFCIHSLSMDV